MESASAMAAACSARLQRERAITSAPMMRTERIATAMIAMNAQSGRPPSEEEAEAPGVDASESAPWDAPPEGALPEDPAPCAEEPDVAAAEEVAGAAMARASDADAASPTAKRRVVEALTASPVVVVPRKVTVAV